MAATDEAGAAEGEAAEGSGIRGGMTGAVGIKWRRYGVPRYTPDH